MIGMIPASQDRRGEGGSTDIQPRTAGLWGDGFHDDSWEMLARVDDWASVEADAYLLLFPRLVPTPGAAVPDSVRRRLCEVTRWSPPGNCDEAATLRTVLRGIDACNLGKVDDESMQRFAFLSGVHPAYLWPAAALRHERATTAGWLGVVARGRPALMPPLVAMDLMRALGPHDGDETSELDATLASMLRAGPGRARARRAAYATMSGQSVVVRGRPLVDWPTITRTLARFVTSVALGLSSSDQSKSASRA